MHIKIRGTRALLYRSQWIAKGSCGNSHGYSVQQFVGSLPLDATSLESEILNRLSAVEQAFVQERVLQPARLRAEQLAKEQERRRIDPVWRLEEAARLTQEAVQLSAHAAVPLNRITAIESQLVLLKTITSAIKRPPDAALSVKTDPLKDALNSIRTARDAVIAGRYGNAPAEGVRNTTVYRLWSQITESVTGSAEDSLLRTLQLRGYAKTRGKSAG